MAVQGLVCGDCGQVVGIINTGAAREMAAAGQQYVYKQCRIKRERALWRAAQGTRCIRKRLRIGGRRG